MSSAQNSSEHPGFGLVVNKIIAEELKDVIECWTVVFAYPALFVRAVRVP
jgi:hypothetical protein